MKTIYVKYSLKRRRQSSVLTNLLWEIKYRLFISYYYRFLFFKVFFKLHTVDISKDKYEYLKNGNIPKNRRIGNINLKYFNKVRLLPDHWVIY